MFARLTDLLLGSRAAVLVVVAVVTAGAVALGPRLVLDFTPQAVFEGHGDLVRDSEAFRRDFGYDDAMVLVVLEATGAGDVLTAEALQWQAQIAADLSRLRQVSAVQSVATLRAAVPADVPPLVRGLIAAAWLAGALPEDRLAEWMRPAPLVPALPVDEAAAARARAALAHLGLIRGMLLSRDSRFAATVVVMDPGARNVADTRRVVADVRRVLADHPLPAGYRLDLAGLPVLRTDVVANLRRDLAVLLPGAALLFLGVLALLYRRVSGTLVPTLAVGVGLAWTVGLLVLAGQSLNIVSNVLPVLLFVIGMANCVHLVSRYAEEHQHAPGERRSAVQRTIVHMSLACLLTSLTTVVGFASLLAARSAVLRALGWHAMAGIALLYVSTIAVSGALLPSFRPPRHCHPESTVHPIGRVVGIAGYAVARHSCWSLVLSAALLAGALWMSQRVAVNSYVLETYPEGHPTVQTMRRVEEHLSGILPLEISLEAAGTDRFLEPAVYRRVAEVQRFAARQEGVLLVRSYVDLHQEVHASLAWNEHLRDDLPPENAAGADRIRRTRAILARLGKSGDSMPGSWAETGDNRSMLSPDLPFVTPDGRRARIMVRLRDLGSRHTLRLIRQLEAELAARFPPQSGIDARLTGDAYLYAVCMTRFVRDLFYSLLGASVIIFGVIALLFRSLRCGLVSILPNLMPLVVTLGYMGLRGYEMNVSNVIVFAISLGIAVDNTIHFLARFREERIEHHSDVPEAVRRAFHGTGRAIVLTTVLIVAGLSVLHFSEFVPSRRFAELTSVTMLGALVGNLLLLPACLMLFWRWRHRNKPPGVGPNGAPPPLTAEG